MLYTFASADDVFHCVLTVAGVLDVFHCVLTDSPEALNVIKDHHIRTIISLIDKHGRDPLVSQHVYIDVICCL